MSESPNQKGRVCPACGEAMGDEPYCSPCLIRNALAHPTDFSDSPSGPASSPFVPLAADFRAPESFGDYQVHERVGEGAMGVVYRARKKSLKKDVAIKFMKAGRAASPRQRALFLREAELASHLEHPNIVTVSEVGERDGMPYLVMRLIEGKPLSERLTDPAFATSVRARVRLLADIVRAVHFAHQRGVIHRDLKPGNILVDATGNPFVGDFGLARWLAHESTVTYGEGTVIGTPAFMPPEHAGGRKENPTVAGDLWSLGVILYLLISGRLPFEAPSIAGVVHRILTTDPVSPFAPTEAGTDEAAANATALRAHDVGRLSGSARYDLESICLRCLEKAPARRYGTAGDLADDLERWLAGVPVVARQAAGAERVVRWVRRHPGASTMIVLAVVAVAALGVNAWQRGVNLRTERLRRVFNYVADMNLAQRGLRERNAILFERAMAAAIPKPGDEDFRGLEWGMLRAQARSLFPPPWFDAGEPLFSLATAHGGGNVAAVGARKLHLVNAQGQLQQSWAIEAEETAGAVAFSPDGTALAVGMATGLEVVRPGATNRVRLAEGRVSQLVYSRDGRRLAAVITGGGTNEGTAIQVFDTAETRRVAILGGNPQSMVWSAAGRLRFTDYKVEIKEWDPGTGAVAPLRPSGYRSPITAFSHSSEWLLRSSVYGSVHLIDLGSGSASTLGHEFLGERGRSVFSWDDSRVAVSSADGTLRVLSVQAGESGAAPMTLATGHAAAVSGIEFSEDASVLFSCGLDGTIRRLPLRSETTPAFERIEHRLLTGAGIGPTFSPDGRHIAVLESRSYGPGQAEESVILWDADARRVAARLPTEMVAWGPKGLALTWDRDARLRVWNMADPTQPRELAAFRINRDQDWRQDTQIAGNGRWLISICYGGVLEAFDVASDQVRRLAVKDLPEARHYRGAVAGNAGPGSPISNPSAKPSIGFLATSPTTEFACFSVEGGRLSLWDFRRNRIIPLTHASVMDLRFSSDGRWLALLDAATQWITLFDGRTGELVETLHGHEGAVLTVEFSADGRQLITGGDDRALVIWNLETRREVFRERLDAPIIWLRASADGQWLVAGHLPHRFSAEVGRPESGDYRLWRLLPGPRAATSATAPAGEVLPDTVWARYAELASRYPPEGTNSPPRAP